MTKLLRLSKDISFPLDTVTGSLVVYGNRGMGKTNWGAILCEELSKARLHFSVIDPMGVWWGLQSSKDGKSPGIPVLLLGGLHGDIPIEPTAGAVCADLVVDENVNVVIDISRHLSGKAWTKGEKIRFVTEYTLRLYERQVEKSRPLLQIYDEAARYAPQTISHGDKDVAACLGAISMLIEEGRNIGVGVCLLTQRSARMAKAVSELAECMIAFRTIGPNSVGAVTDWLGEHVDKKRVNEMTAQLRTLPVGSALVVSPGWLQFEGVVNFRERETFDSSKTPKPGERRLEPVNPAKPNLIKYRDLMKATVEKAQENDPKSLKRKVAELLDAQETDQQRIAQLETAIQEQTGIAPCDHEPLILDLVQRIRNAEQAYEPSLHETVIGIERLIGELQTVETEARHVLLRHRGSFSIGLDDITESLDAAKSHKMVQLSGARHSGRSAVTRLQPGSPIPRGVIDAEQVGDRRRLSTGTGPGDESMSKGERTTLIAAAQYPNGVSRGQLGCLTDYKKSSRNSFISLLTTRGYLKKNGDRINATPEGVAALGEFERLPTGRALVAYYLKNLKGGELEVFKAVVDAGRAGVTKAKIDEKTGYKKSSRNSYVSKLQTRELVVSPRKSETVTLSDHLL